MSYEGEGEVGQPKPTERYTGQYLSLSKLIRDEVILCRII